MSTWSSSRSPTVSRGTISASGSTEAKREGVAVLLTTHQLAFARGIADRAVLLADGEVVQDGPYEEVIEGESVYERGLL